VVARDHSRDSRIGAKVFAIGNERGLFRFGYSPSPPSRVINIVMWRLSATADCISLQRVGESAKGINDAGQISGWGLLNGRERGFLLTPR
jgi:hypothetical protein